MNRFSATTGKSLDIGRAVQGGAAIIVRNIVPFGLMSLVLAGLPSMLTGIGDMLPQRNPGHTLVPVLGWLLGLAGTSLLYGSLIFATSENLDGRQVTLLECLRVGRRRWLGLLGLSLLQTLLCALGLILFILPGVLLILRWSVATSCMVVEKRSIRAAMRRSAELTRGRRGSILLLVLIYLVIFLIAYLAASALAGAFAPGGYNHPLYYFVLAPLLNAFNDMMMIGMFTALFVQLRSDRDVGTVELLEEVFA